jgi:undecaprenyl-diphosphatase
MTKRFILKLQGFDHKLSRKIFNWHGKKSLDHFMRLASEAGNGYYYPVVGAMINVFDFAATKMLFPIAAVSFVIELSIYGTIKLTTKRTRPCHRFPEMRNLVKLQDRFSFPSGHAAAAVLIATVIRFFYPGLSLPLYMSAGAIGFSRIYNGLHYPSDVLAGSALGYASAKLSILFLV